MLSFYRVLKVFSENSGGLLLTTTFSDSNFNKELKLSGNPGRYRKLNLEIPPYSLQPPLCISRDGIPDDSIGPEIFLGLWKLPLRRVRRCKETYSLKFKSFEVPYFSCVDWSLKKDVDSNLQNISRYL